MARLFDDASSQYLQYAGGVLTAVPLTVSCWFRSDDITINQDLVTLVNSATAAGGDCFRVALRGATAGDPVAAIANDAPGPAGVALSPTGYSANTWHHVVARFDAADYRDVRLDGGTAGTNTDAGRTPSGINRTTIGALRQATSVVFMSGRIAEVAIWNAYVSTANCLALARGISPLSIRPLSLVAYWPLWGVHSTEIDNHPRSVVATDYDMAVTGATAANHAPVIPFSKRFWMPSQSLTVYSIAPNRIKAFIPAVQVASRF